MQSTHTEVNGGEMAMAGVFHVNLDGDGMVAELQRREKFYKFKRIEMLEERRDAMVSLLEIGLDDDGIAIRAEFRPKIKRELDRLEACIRETL
ncbi:MAG: hypothetical protein JWN86_1765 [Planctomycetota bacterium]|nr:hypothetical protein [Planctomycetota bacterium]